MNILFSLLLVPQHGEGLIPPSPICLSILLKKKNTLKQQYSKCLYYKEMQKFKKPTLECYRCLQGKESIADITHGLNSLIQN